MKIENAKILVVDDDALMRKYIMNMLDRLGVKSAMEADDGNSGLTAADSFKPDLVLSDIHMYPMGGLEFVKRLRAHPSADLRKVPVLMMSADSSGDTLRDSVSLGIAAYIVKPPLTLSLKTKIERALKFRA